MLTCTTAVLITQSYSIQDCVTLRFSHLCSSKAKTHVLIFIYIGCFLMLRFHMGEIILATSQSNAYFGEEFCLKNQNLYSFASA